MVLALLSCSQVMSQNPINYVRVWICGEIGRFTVNHCNFQKAKLYLGFKQITIVLWFCYLNSSFKDKKKYTMGLFSEIDLFKLKYSFTKIIVSCYDSIKFIKVKLWSHSRSCLSRGWIVCRYPYKYGKSLIILFMRH